MGRRLAGSTPRNTLVGVRLNDEELEDLEAKKAARGIKERADYYRTLQQEDEGPQ
jgi:hypothetical protein